MKTILGLAKKIAIVLLVLVVIGVIFGRGSGDDEKEFSSDQGKVEVSATEGEEGAQGADEQKQTEKPKEKYTITDEALDASSPYSIYITGVLTNNTDKNLEYLQVEYNLYDSEGYQVGTAIDNINNLKAGGTWKFKAVCLDFPDDVASFELADVSGF